MSCSMLPGIRQAAWLLEGAKGYKGTSHDHMDTCLCAVTFDFLSSGVVLAKEGMRIGNSCCLQDAEILQSVFDFFQCIYLNCSELL